MKKWNILTRAVLPALAMLALAPSAYAAADYSFTTDAPQDYYKSTSYEDIYGSSYNYGGKNVVDYQVPELEYGVQSTTMTGVMERTILPGLQQTVATGGGGYGVAGGGGPITVLVEAGTPGTAGTQTPTVPTTPTVQQPAYTSVEGMAYKDGSIGTIKIPSLKINMKVWESETILVVSGERRQESAGRAKYNEMEIHRTNATAKAHRLVHQWRSVIDWDEAQAWEIIKRWHIAPHPCYAAGWNRCSCMMCIFSLPTHWAGIRELFPERFAEVEEDERVLGFTLDNEKCLSEYVGNAKSCVCHRDPQALYQLTRGEFSVSDVGRLDWTIPAGAFHGAAGGPC